MIGGHTKRAARRAGELGDGFFPGKGSVEELTELVAIVRASAERAGRNPENIELTTGWRRNPDELKRLADIGFTRYTVPPPAFDLEKLPDAMARLAETVNA